MSNFEYSNLLFIKWRSGLVDNPYIDLTESRKIAKNTTVLHEVPDEEYRVRITGYTEKTMDQYNKTKTIGLSEFVVNYNVGFVLFNEAKNGVTLTITYKGRGVIMYPAERIYYDHPEMETVTKTLQDLSVLGEIALENVGDLSDLQNKIDLAIETANSLDSGIETGNTLSTSLQNLTTTANTAKTNLNTSITNANTAKTNLDTSIANATPITTEIATGQQLKTDLNSSISTGSTLKTNLDTSITNGNTAKTNLDTSTTTANTTKTNLDASNTTANTTKTNLDASNTTANTTKTNLDNSNTTANTTKTNLDGSISTGNTLKTGLDGSITSGNTLKTNLDESISNATDINTTLNGSVVAGQNKIEEMDDKIVEANTAITNINTAKNNANDVSDRLSIFEVYNNTKVYYPLNKVSYSGSSYVCILQTTAGTLPSNTTYWTIIAQAGSGNVSSVNGDVSGDVIVVNPSSNPVISINSGTGANQLLKIGSDGLIPVEIIPNLSWANITGKPTSTVDNIDDAVTKRHTHSNQSILDATTASFTTALNTKLTGVATGANVVGDSTTNGNILIAGEESVVYTHPSGDGNLHIPVTSTTNNNKVLKAGATAGSISWSDISFSELTSKPTTISGYGITNAMPSNADASTTGNLSVGGLVTASTPPTLNAHLTNKEYVDAQIAIAKSYAP